MFNKKNILLVIILSLCSLTLQAKTFKIDFNKKTINLPKKKIVGPDFWMFKNIHIQGYYPSYTDSASAGVGEGYFNFGQAPFKGDPKGYKPYDPNYNKSLWVNASFNGAYVKPPNDSNAYYKKSYSSGKYYFEITVGGTSYSDLVGISSASTLQMNFNSNSSVYIGGVGGIATHNTKNENGTLNIYWDYFDVNVGTTLQVYLDYDDGNILIKKLGTTENDYVNVLH